MLSAPTVPEQETRNEPPDVVSQALWKLSKSTQAQWSSGEEEKLSAEQTEEDMAQGCFNAQVRAQWTVKDESLNVNA